jgi:hypothetical protein
LFCFCFSFAMSRSSPPPPLVAPSEQALRDAGNAMPTPDVGHQAVHLGAVSSSSALLGAFHSVAVFQVSSRSVMDAVGEPDLPQMDVFYTPEEAPYVQLTEADQAELARQLVAGIAQYPLYAATITATNSHAFRPLNLRTRCVDTVSSLEKPDAVEDAVMAAIRQARPPGEICLVRSGC